MAAVNPQDSISLDQSIPQWKRELILRRRALSRSLPAGNTSVKLTCPSVVTAVKQADQATVAEESTVKYQRRLPTPPAVTKGSLEETQTDFLPSDRGAISSLAFAESPVVVSNMRLVEHRTDAGNDVMNGVSMGSSPISHSSVKCWDRMDEEKPSQSSVSKMQKNNRVVMSENNNCLDGNDSDSSEELQYGPGIVNRLKDKYMSMTLRENQSRVMRASFNNMRRAASLENLIETEDLSIEKQQIKVQPRYTKRSDVSSDSNVKHTLPQHHRYRNINRGNDSMKRARSVETLLRCDSRTHLSGRSVASDLPGIRDSRKSAQFVKSLYKDDIVIVENKSKTESNVATPEDKQNTPKGPMSPKIRSPSVASETELPPPDLVKQTLKIFERRPQPESTSSKSFSNNSPKTVTNHSSPTSGALIGTANKPILSPKPSPDKIAQGSVARPLSPRKVSTKSEQVLFSQLKSSTPEIPVSPSRSPINVMSPHARLQSPSPTSEIYKLFSTNDSEMDSTSTIYSVTNDPIRATTGLQYDVGESTNGHMRVISPVALENIRKCGMSEKYQFVHNTGDAADKPKTHLPGVQVPGTSKTKCPSPDTIKPENSPVKKLSPDKSTDSQLKQVGIIKPIVTSKPVSNSFLTNREKEKNFKNREKSSDQAAVHINKVTDASANSSETGRSQTENSDIFPTRVLRETKGSGLWDKKPAGNELTYNFVNSKTSIPDYIPNDGLILRKTPIKPRAGESGYIRLSGSSDESSTDADADADACDDGPPSPCNVVFEGGNVLINGRSNMRKDNKSRKMHISFNDSATTTFEYPSEASLMGEVVSPVSGVSPPAGGSSLASYTPSKVVLGTEGFQLGVTRTLPNSIAPITVKRDSSQKDEAEELDQHLKPAEDGETMAWSEGNTADLLF